MTDKVVILVTAGKVTEAKRIARQLVGSKLAACVNILPRVQSIYRWQGKVADEKEFLILIKSRRDLFSELRAAVLKLHSYTTPEIVCLPIVDGLSDYLQWVGDSVKQAQT
jgi:periplasmic divalent cation tolerance protein